MKNLRSMELQSTPVNKPRKLKVVWNSEPKEELDSILDRMNQPETLEPGMTVFKVGYWRGIPRKGFDGVTEIIDFPDCPPVENFIDLTWSKEERNKVVEYLGLGDEKHRFCGYSTCRICGKHNNGDACLTDGKWVWPSGLAHYLMKHSVKPPQEFIDHVLKNFDTLKKHWEDDLIMRYRWKEMCGVHTKSTSMIKFLYQYHEGEDL